MTKERKFILVKGGKLAGLVGGSGGRGSGGGGIGGGGPGPPGPAFRPHWLAELLFAAISRTHEELWDNERAHSYREISMRMTLLSTTYLGRYVTIDEPMVTRALNVVRSQPFAYQWTVEYVQKGAAGEDRGFFPILADLDSDGADLQYLDQDDHDYAKFGCISFARTLATMIRHQRWAMNMLSASDPAFAAFAAACAAALAEADNLVNEAQAIP